MKRLMSSILTLVLLLFTSTARAADGDSEKLAAAIAQLDQIVEQTMAKTGVPGVAITVVHRDRAARVSGFGVRESGKPERIDPNTVFLLASVSKPITSTIIAGVVGRGTIDWDNRIIDHDPGFRLFDPFATRELTFRDLLCHRSGLADHEGDLLEDLGYDRTAVLHRLRFAKPAISFRSGYAYTNFGVTEAAVAAARAAGKTWEDLAADTLYRPLGMRSTSSRFKDYRSAENRAKLHARVNGQWVAKFVRDPDAQSPGGGVSSTATDLVEWLRLQLAGGKHNGRLIVGSAALAETHRPQIVSIPPRNPAIDHASFYGLGWNVGYDAQGRVRLNHSGGFDLGAATFVALVPSEDLGIAVLTNGAPQGIPEAIGASFLDLALKGKIEKDYLAMYEEGFRQLSKPPYGAGADYSQPPRNAQPPLPVHAYAGRYRNEYYGEIEIVDAGHGLEIAVGPKKVRLPLRHWNRDVFLYQPAGEMAAGLSTAIFTVGREQRAAGVVLENLNSNGQGDFTRVPDAK